MKQHELEELNDEKYKDQISIVDVVTQCFDQKCHSSEAITLCLGYRTNNDIVHIYTKDDKIHSLVLRHSNMSDGILYDKKYYIIVEYVAGPSLHISNLIPDHIDSNKSLFTFCRLLKETGYKPINLMTIDPKAKEWDESCLTLQFAIK